MKSIHITGVLGLVLLFGIVEIRCARAETIIVNNSSSVVTNTSVQAESGGNSQSSGTDGSSSATVKSKTIVNGEVVESFEKTVTGANGSPASIKYEKSYATSSGSGNVQVSNSIKAEAKSTNTKKAASSAASQDALTATASTSASSTAAASVSSASTTATSSPVVAKSLWSRLWLRAGALLRNIFIF